MTNRVPRKFNLLPDEAELLRKMAFESREDAQDLVGKAIRLLAGRYEKEEFTPEERQLIKLYRKDAEEGSYEIEGWNILLGRLGLPRLRYPDEPKKTKK